MKDLKSCSVLVVDDKVENCASARQQLSRLVKELHIANSVEEATKQLGNYDLVLLDLMMPTGVFRGTLEGAIDKEVEHPYGLAFAIQALNTGATVMILTMTNHHQHPISAVLDHLPATDRFSIVDGRYHLTEVRAKDWVSALSSHLFKGKENQLVDPGYTKKEWNDYVESLRKKLLTEYKWCTMTVCANEEHEIAVLGCEWVMQPSQEVSDKIFVVHGMDPMYMVRKHVSNQAARMWLNSLADDAKSFEYVWKGNEGPGQKLRCSTDKDEPFENHISDRVF